jgi:hypothetical protein
MAGECACGRRPLVPQSDGVVTPEYVRVDDGARHPWLVPTQAHALEGLIGNAKRWLAKAGHNRRLEAQGAVVLRWPLQEHGGNALVLEQLESVADEFRPDAATLVPRQHRNGAEHGDLNQSLWCVEPGWREQDGPATAPSRSDTSDIAARIARRSCSSGTTRVPWAPNAARCNASTASWSVRRSRRISRSRIRVVHELAHQ